MGARATATEQTRLRRGRQARGWVRQSQADDQEDDGDQGGSKVTRGGQSKSVGWVGAGDEESPTSGQCGSDGREERGAVHGPLPVRRWRGFQHTPHPGHVQSLQQCTVVLPHLSSYVSTALWSWPTPAWYCGSMCTSQGVSMLARRMGRASQVTASSSSIHSSSQQSSCMMEYQLCT